MSAQYFFDYSEFSLNPPDLAAGQGPAIPPDRLSAENLVVYDLVWLAEVLHA